MKAKLEPLDRCGDLWQWSAFVDGGPCLWYASTANARVDVSYWAEGYFLAKKVPSMKRPVALSTWCHPLKLTNAILTVSGKAYVRRISLLRPQDPDECLWICCGFQFRCEFVCTESVKVATHAV